MTAHSLFRTILTDRRKQIASSLRDKAYREALVEDNILTGIPIQIRELRKREGWKQQQLAEHSGQRQSRISLLETVGYGSYTVKTLARIAAAFDVALIVKFAPFSELVERMAGLSSEDILVPRYEEDTALWPQGAPTILFKPTLVSQGQQSIAGYNYQDQAAKRSQEVPDQSAQLISRQEQEASLVGLQG